MGHQINQSILVLVIIYMGFWLTSILSHIILPNLAIENATTKLFYSQLFVQVTRLATVLNAPVLYFSRQFTYDFFLPTCSSFANSSEYRSAFRQEICRFIGRGQQPQHGIPNAVTNVHQQRQQNQLQKQRRQPMINNMMTTEEL
jgi:hypothetical protein